MHPTTDAGAIVQAVGWWSWSDVRPGSRVGSGRWSCWPWVSPVSCSVCSRHELCIDDALEGWRACSGLMSPTNEAQNASTNSPNSWPTSDDHQRQIWAWIHDDRRIEALVAVAIDDAGDEVGGLRGVALPCEWVRPLRGVVCGYLDDLFVDPYIRRGGAATYRRLRDSADAYICRRVLRRALCAVEGEACQARVMISTRPSSPAKSSGFLV